MKKLYKLTLKLFGWGEARFGTKAEQIITAMTTEPMLTLMPEPIGPSVATRVEGTTALADYKAAALLAADGSKTAIKDREQKRVVLEGVLSDWAPEVELAAKKANDVTILEKSGYDLRTVTPKSTTNGVPPAPVILVKRGLTAGSVFVRTKPVLQGVDTYEAEYTTGDPTADANYTGRITSKTGSRIPFADLEIAKLHNFRVRGVGSTGPGDWSDPVGIIVT